MTGLTLSVDGGRMLGTAISPPPPLVP
jgi:hypothetical protein